MYGLNLAIVKTLFNVLNIIDLHYQVILFLYFRVVVI